VAQVALLALPDRPVQRGLADAVTGVAGEARHRRPLDRVQRIAHFVGLDGGFGNRFILGAFFFRQIFQADSRHIGGQPVAAGRVLADLFLVAGLTHGGRGRGQHIGALVFDRARVIFIDFMAVDTFYVRRGHGAEAVLLDDARRGVAVAFHAVIVAAGQRIDPFAPFGGPVGLFDSRDDQDQAQDDDHTHQADDQHAPGGEPISPAV